MQIKERITSELTRKSIPIPATYDLFWNLADNTLLFFTTNKKAGTGLGMHIVYNLVTQRLKGKIECESKPGEGIIITMQMPVK